MTAFVGRFMFLALVFGLSGPAMSAPDLSLPPRLKGSSVGVVPAIQRPSGARGLVSLPPRLRPGSAQTATSGQTPTAPQIVSSGPQRALCGDRSIRGERLMPIQGPSAACRIDAPVRVASISGISLNPAAVMTCASAKATKTWIVDGAVPAWGRLGNGLAQLDVGASYECAKRNNQSNALASAHGQGTAIDIKAFTLKNGTRISVESGWRDPLAGQVLRDIHKSGCREFRTVLGPGAGQSHNDRLHFDLSAGRRTCR